MRPVEREELRPFGRGLSRPECVKVRGSEIIVSDQQHVLVELSADGRPRPLVQNPPEGFLANGFSLSESGSIFVANLGDGPGIWVIHEDGELRPSAVRFEGAALPPANYINLVATDTEPEAAYISVSTRQVPRDRAFDRSIADGFLLYVDSSGARIVADGIGFTNENKLSPDGECIYVTETIARRLSRYRVLGAGVLGERETVVEFAEGIWPDGFAFDEFGDIWVASVLSNRLLRVHLGGDDGVGVDVVLDESAPDVVASAIDRFENNTFDRTDFVSGASSRLGNLASVAFGGADMRTVYLGSLANDHLMTFRSSVGGAPTRR